MHTFTILIMGYTWVDILEQEQDLDPSTSAIDQHHSFPGSGEATVYDCVVQPSNKEIEGHGHSQNDSLNEMNNELKRCGRRALVDMDDVELQLHRAFDDHSCDGLCQYKDIRKVYQSDYALRTHFRYMCNRCHVVADIWSELREDSRMDLGYAAVCASIHSGKI